MSQVIDASILTHFASLEDDVSFHEDACRIRRDFAPQNMALLRHPLNLLSQDSSSKRGIAARRKRAAWDHTYLIKLLTQ